jgi:hypothetical protein
MNRHTRTITVGGKTYTLTAKRALIIQLGEICPELLKLDPNTNVETLDEAFEIEAGLKIATNMDAIFYDMIKIAHPQITREKSDEIYEAFCSEYNDVEMNLIKFMKSVFSDGIPRENKKNLNW